VLARATRTLHCCLKELASKRLLAARRKYTYAEAFCHLAFLHSHIFSASCR